MAEESYTSTAPIEEERSIRQRFFGWFYGSNKEEDSFCIRFSKASFAMLLVYSFGILGYFLLIHGFMDMSLFTLVCIMFPCIISWFAGIDVFLKNPVTLKHRAENPGKSVLIFGIVGLSLFAEWFWVTALFFGSMAILP